MIWVILKRFKFGYQSILFMQKICEIFPPFMILTQSFQMMFEGFGRVLWTECKVGKLGIYCLKVWVGGGRVGEVNEVLNTLQQSLLLSITAATVRDKKVVCRSMLDIVETLFSLL